MKKKGALEISFAWIFAVVIGAIILFIAIFASVKLIGIGETQMGAKAGKEIGILLNPLETGFESAKSVSFTMPVLSRIYGRCDNEGNFGRQLIEVSQQSFNKWTQTDLEVQFPNKYIFNEEYVEGKKFYVFSKPFNFPFKVADLIFLTSSEKEYCFVNAPEEIQREIKGISQKNMLVENCSLNSIKICFESDTGCLISVDYNGKSVQKSSEKVYFEDDALMYAAIFSDKEIYECQVQRLMKRVNELSKLYQDKISVISRSGCNSNLGPELDALSSLAKGVQSSANLGFALISTVKTIEEDNSYASECKLW